MPDPDCPEMTASPVTVPQYVHACLCGEGPATPTDSLPRHRQPAASATRSPISVGATATNRDLSIPHTRLTDDNAAHDDGQNYELRFGTIRIDRPHCFRSISQTGQFIRISNFHAHSFSPTSAHHTAHGWRHSPAHIIAPEEELQQTNGAHACHTLLLRVMCTQTRRGI